MKLPQLYSLSSGVFTAGPEPLLPKLSRQSNYASNGYIEWTIFIMSINLRTLDLNLLRVLVELGETGSVSVAAAQLGLSQSASSNALSRLRHALGDPLFVRSRTGMVPTPFAERIIPDVRRHLDGLFESLSEGSEFDPANSKRVFRLSLSGLGETVFLPRLAIQALQVAPDIKLFNHSTPLPMLAQALEDGDVDLAIGMVNIRERGIRAVTLFDEDYVAIVGKGLNRRPKDLEELRKEKIVLSVPEATYANDINDSISRLGLSGSVVLRVGYFGALPQLLSQLDVVVIAPRQYANDLSRTHQIEVLPFSISKTASSIKMVWHTRTDSELACVWLRSQVADLFLTSKSDLEGSVQTRSSDSSVL